MERHRPATRAALAVAAGYPAAVAALSLLNVVAPQGDGLLALSQILAPHLAASVVAFVPLAFVGRPRALRVALAAALLLGAVRFGPGLVSLPAAPAAPSATVLRLLSWNLEVGGVATAEVVRVLTSSDADVVALEELTPGVASAIAGDAGLAARYPYRAVYAAPGAGGIGLLSRVRLSGATHHDAPVAIEADLLVGKTTVRIVAGHPYPAAIGTVGSLRLPVGFDARDRDASIARLRAWVDPVVAAREPLVVVGDFNVTDREPAYGVLARGLLDAHLEVGQGPGSTWRPDRMKFLPFGVLRIDHVLTGGGVRPLSAGEDCRPRGTDHCIVAATVEVEIERAP